MLQEELTNPTSGLFKNMAERSDDQNYKQSFFNTRNPFTDASKRAFDGVTSPGTFKIPDAEITEASNFFHNLACRTSNLQPENQHYFHPTREQAERLMNCKGQAMSENDIKNWRRAVRLIMQSWSEDLIRAEGHEQLAAERISWQLKFDCLQQQLGGRSAANHGQGRFKQPDRCDGADPIEVDIWWQSCVAWQNCDNHHCFAPYFKHIKGTTVGKLNNWFTHNEPVLRECSVNEVKNKLMQVFSYDQMTAYLEFSNSLQSQKESNDGFILRMAKIANMAQEMIHSKALVPLIAGKLRDIALRRRIKTDKFIRTIDDMIQVCHEWDSAAVDPTRNPRSFVTFESETEDIHSVSFVTSQGKVSCSYCKKEGHLEARCYERKDKEHLELKQEVERLKADFAKIMKLN